MGAKTIVIGGGLNGLTAATLLARSGRDVTLLEARETFGGLAAPHEFAEGYRSPGLLHDTSRVRRSVVDSLGLEVTWRASPPLHLPGDGRGLIVDPGHASLEGASKAEANRYRRFCELGRKLGRPLRRLLDDTPPGLLTPGVGGTMRLLRVALSFRRLGARSLVTLMRLAPMSVADWLNDSFDDERIKAAICLPAIAHDFVGPRSAGTALRLLLHQCAAGEEIAGGPGALAAALTAAAKDAGVTLRANAAVKTIRISARGAVEGVTLESGDLIDATCVAASCDPKQTLVDLCQRGRLPLRLQTDALAFRARGVTAKVHLALSGPLELAAFPKATIERAQIGDSLDVLERAFDPVKYGELGKEPALDVRIPTVSDSSLVDRPGHHVVSIMVHFAPRNLHDGWTEGKKEELAAIVVERLASHAPALKERVVGKEVLSPRDIEARYRLSGGHVLHGEHALDQLFFLRPTIQCAAYGTPIEGLFLCGGGSHPGGGLTCMPGALAAATIMRRPKG